MKITLAYHKKILEGVKKALREQQAEIESLKLGMLYLHNHLESMNTAPVEQTTRTWPILWYVSNTTKSYVLSFHFAAVADGLVL